MRKKYYGDAEPKKERPSLKKATGKSGWDIFTGAAGIVAGGCASATVHKYLSAAVPKGGNLFEKAVIAAGVYFVTGLVGHKVEQYVMGELADLQTSMNIAKQAYSKAGEKQEGGEDAGDC